MVHKQKKRKGKGKGKEKSKESFLCASARRAIVYCVVTQLKQKQ